MDRPKTPFDYEYSLYGDVVRLIKNTFDVDVQKETLEDRFEFYRFEINGDKFVITFFKKLNIWTISIGSRVFSSFFDGAHLTDDRKTIRFFTLSSNRGYNYTSSLFIRNSYGDGNIPKK